MGRKGDSKRKTKAVPVTRANANNSVTDLVKGKEAPSVKTGVEPVASPNRSQKKR